MHQALIVDGHPVSRMAMKILVERMGYQVVGETGSGLEAVKLASLLMPTITILDLDVSKLDGLDVIKRISGLSSSSKIIVFTARQPDVYASRCIDAGALAYVVKSEQISKLEAAIRAVQAGYHYFPDNPEKNSNSAVNNKLSRLSNRELSVLRRLAQGQSNIEIAKNLLINSKTISAYKCKILNKLELSNLVELSDFARKNSLI